MIEHRHFFQKIKGASEETPLRSPIRAIHLRLADYQKTIRKGRKVQTYSGTIQGCVIREVFRPGFWVSEKNMPLRTTHGTDSIESDTSIMFF